MQAWRWAALLGFALLAPVGLPAGGGDRRSLELRRRESSWEPLLSPRADLLRAAPQDQAPPLAELASGTPLRLLRGWRDRRGRVWLHVEGSDGRGYRLRGWLQARRLA